MYKLIALDLDGTLLTDDKKITKDNLDIINYLIDIGYEIVIATGRSYYSARAITNIINRHLIYICNNGNIIRDAIDDRVISATFLNTEDSKIILQKGLSRELYPLIHVDFFVEGFDILVFSSPHYNGYYNNEQKFYSRVKIIEENQLEDLEKVLAIVYPGKLKILNDFHYMIKEMYPNKFNSHIVENAAQAEALLEVMNPFATKWNSLIKYANSIGIKENEIIAIGDNNNDIEMIINAGLGIAMKNGSKMVKEVADIVSLKDNNESGVAFELKRILSI